VIRATQERRFGEIAIEALGEVPASLTSMMQALASSPAAGVDGGDDAAPAPGAAEHESAG